MHHILSEVPRLAAIEQSNEGQDLITPGESPQSCQHEPPRHHVGCTDRRWRAQLRPGWLPSTLAEHGSRIPFWSSPQCALEWSSEPFHSRHDLLGDSPTDQTSHDITCNDAPVFGALSSSPCGLLRLPLALLPGPIVHTALKSQCKSAGLDSRGPRCSEVMPDG